MSTNHSATPTHTPPNKSVREAQWRAVEQVNRRDPRGGLVPPGTLPISLSPSLSVFDFALQRVHNKLSSCTVFLFDKDMCINCPLVKQCNWTVFLNDTVQFSQLCVCTEEREVAEKLFCCDSSAQCPARTLVNPLSTIGGGDEIVNHRKKFPITSSSLLIISDACLFVVRLVADCTLQYFGYFSFFPLFNHHS